jgi:putative ABC transport system substrate-binding protein
VEVLVASTEDEIDAAFGAAVQRGAGALLVGGDAYFNSRRAQFIALAARHGLPTNFDRREIAMAGGLMRKNWCRTRPSHQGSTSHCSMCQDIANIS